MSAKEQYYEVVLIYPSDHEQSIVAERGTYTECGSVELLITNKSVGNLISNLLNAMIQRGDIKDAEQADDILGALVELRNNLFPDEPPAFYEVMGT